MLDGSLDRHQVGLDPTPPQQMPPDRSLWTPPKDKHRTRSLPVSVYKRPTTTVTTSRRLIKKSIKTLSKDSKYPNINPPMPPSQVPIVPQFDPLTGSKDPPFYTNHPQSCRTHYEARICRHSFQYQRIRERAEGGY